MEIQALSRQNEFDFMLSLTCTPKFSNVPPAKRIKSPFATKTAGFIFNEQ
jgi:hypothetical protein